MVKPCLPTHPLHPILLFIVVYQTIIFYNFSIQTDDQSLNIGDFIGKIELQNWNLLAAAAAKDLLLRIS